MKSRMTGYHSHTVTRNCDQTQAKIHSVAELLLLSGTLRPICTESTNGVQVSIAAAKEQIKGSLNLTNEIVGDIVKTMGDFESRWKVLCDMLYRLSDSVTVLVELCYHVTYDCLATGKNSSSQNLDKYYSQNPDKYSSQNSDKCNNANTHDEPLVDKYNTSYAGLEIKLSCNQLKRARMDELTATFIMDICSNISKYISILTDNCRNASEHAGDSSTRDQFKLGIKSVTCAAGSLIASIKSYKGDKSPQHHARVVTFCEPVLAASHALVCFATEEEFIDKGIQLSDEEKTVQKSVFGPCMNIVSGCVQVCKVLRDFAHDSHNSNYIHKAKLCHTSIHKSTNQLKVELQRHFKMEFGVKGVSPIRLTPEEKGQASPVDKMNNGLENSRELSPFGRSSPQPGGSFLKEDGGLNRGDHSPQSSVATSELSFSTGSLSR